jgi:hypothetical protein
MIFGPLPDSGKHEVSVVAVQDECHLHWIGTIGIPLAGRADFP